MTTHRIHPQRTCDRCSHPAVLLIGDTYLCQYHALRTSPVCTTPPSVDPVSDPADTTQT